jgi:hypothetical protein
MHLGLKNIFDSSSKTSFHQDKLHFVNADRINDAVYIVS